MQRETVWLVEDEQGIADTLVYMLQQEGFAVEVFERGLPVLDKAPPAGTRRHDSRCWSAGY